MTSLFNCILKEKRILSGCDKNVIVNCFQHKDEAIERRNYRVLKLLGHMMKIFERIIEKEIRKVIDVSEMQFGFMPGRVTIYAIFIACQLQEKYLGKKKNFYFAFADLEKAFDGWAMRKLNADVWLIETIMAMYEFSNSAIRVHSTVGNKFNVKVGIRQGSVLIPLLFIMVLETLSREF